MRTSRLVPLALAGLLLAAGAAHARPTFHPGIEAGWQSSTLLYDEPSDFWNTTGWGNTFTGGATLDVPVARGFGLATGARYLCYSNHVTFSGSVSFGSGGPAQFDGQFRLRANYVAAPVMVTYAPRQAGPRLGLGTELAFLTSARVLTTGRFAGFESTSYQDIRSQLKPVDVSLCATLGWAVPLEDHAVVARLRFTRGLTDAAKDEDWATNWKTTGLDGTLGVRW